MELLASYRRLLDLSQRMLPLVRAEDWDAVSALQEERSALVAALPPALPPLPPGESQAVRAAIAQILACDAEMRDYLLPCHAQLEKLLARR